MLLLIKILLIFSELDELKDQLLDTPLSEEIVKKIQRTRSLSESGSDQVRNGSLSRQKSVDSSEREKSPRKSSATVETVKNGPKKGEKLIEAEKAETGNVSWQVYKHYLKSIGFFLMLTTLLLNLVYQGFSVGSNVWLGVWADDKKIIVNKTVDTGRRDMYLGVYGALGIGQGM